MSSTPTAYVGRADAGRIPLRSKSVDLVIGSPPYTNCRTYLEDGNDLGIARKCDAWIDWMLGVTAEALRVSRGLVLWVVAGKTEDWNYQPAPEGLLYRWWAQGGECHCFRPCYWHRYGISGSGGEQWYRADVEYVLAFKRPGRLPHGVPTANGRPPRFKPGGTMSHRLKDGKRMHIKNASGERRAGGEIQHYAPPDIANPGVLLSTGAAGGGQLGSPIAHENEAPYPVAVPKFFIASHVPPGGTVCDPFSGSGTTGQAAMELARNYIGFDLRQSQALLSRKRLGTITPGFSFMGGEAEPAGMEAAHA